MYCTSMKRKLLQIPISSETAEMLEAVAKMERRSKAAQAAIMLEKALFEVGRGTENTQLSLPTTPEDRAAALERIR